MFSSILESSAKSVVGTAQQASKKAKREAAYKHVGASGRVYTSARPLTAKDRKQIDDYDEQVEVPKTAPYSKALKTAGAGVAEAAPSTPKRNNMPTSIGAPTPEGIKAAEEYERFSKTDEGRVQELMELNPKLTREQAENTVAKSKGGTPFGSGSQAVLNMQRLQGQARGVIDPVLGPITESAAKLGLTPGISLGALATGQNDSKLARDLVVGGATEAVTSPFVAVAGLTQAQDPNLPTGQRLGAFAEALAAILPVEEMALKTGAKIVKGAKSLKGAAKGGAEAFEKALGQAEGAGIPTGKPPKPEPPPATKAAKKEAQAKAKAEPKTVPDIEEATTPMAASAPKAEPPPSNVFRVNGRDYEVPDDIATQIREMEASSKDHLAFKKRQMEAGIITRQQYEADAKAIAMTDAAKKRRLLGALTDKERAAELKRLNSNHVGKEVETPLGPGVVKGNSFGKVRVELPDGRVVSVDPADIKANPITDLPPVQGVKEYTPRPPKPLEAPAPKPATTVKAEPPPKPEPPAGQGISHAEVARVREDLGFDKPAKETRTDAEIAEAAKKLDGKERGIAEDVLADTKRTLKEDESFALGVKLQRLKGEMDAAKQGGDADAWNLANDEARAIADALDESGSRQGRAFRARQYILNDQYDSWAIQRRAEKANAGNALEGKQAAKLDERIKELETTNANLAKERDAAVKAYQDLIKTRKPSSSRRGAQTPSQRRSSALASLKRLGVPVNETDDVLKATPAASGPGPGTKQSGAISIPEGAAEQIARQVRSLVRTYADEGVTNWDGVMKGLKRDLPGIEEEQALFILSGKYKKAKLEADVARKKADAFMRAVKGDAEFRAKNWGQKLAKIGGDILNTTQRSLQTTLDDSMALIQGKNVLVWKPGTWFKAVGTSLQAAVKKDPIGFARKVAAEMEAHPLYKRANQAGLELSDVDGAFSKQEEAFAGMLENKVPGLSHSKAMATVLMNKMRFDLFRKLAAAGPDTPEYLHDIAQQINIATGKGQGEVAKLLGSKPAGLVSYAPRYYLAKWQHNLGVPFWKAKTFEGKSQAMKMYASQLAGYMMLARAAELFGFEVDKDVRSATYGRAAFRDGSYSFDLLYQQSEGIRVLSQFTWGRISKGGKYSEPGDYGDYGPGEYLESKLAPGARSISMAATGKTFDEATGKRRDAEPADFWKSYIPLSVREQIKNAGPTPGATVGKGVASFFGAGIDKPGEGRKTEKPFSWMPPGLKRILD